MVTSGAGRPKGGYFIDGKKVPGVTTVLNKFKDPGPLMHWAWQCGMLGKNYRDVSGAAATAGSITHARIEADILGQDSPQLSAEQFDITSDAFADIMVKSDVAMDAYWQWRRGVGMEVLHTELPLLSRGMQVGGTIDAIVKINGKLFILDWKTSNAVYPEYIIQLSAYRAIWNENCKLDELIDHAYLLRIDKILGTFTFYYWPSEVLVIGLESFLAMRRLYDLNKRLAKAVG